MKIQIINPEADYPISKLIRISVFKVSKLYKIEKLIIDFIYKYLVKEYDKNRIVWYTEFKSFILLDFQRGLSKNYKKGK